MGVWLSFWQQPLTGCLQCLKYNWLLSMSNIPFGLSLILMSTVQILAYIILLTWLLTQRGTNNLNTSTRYWACETRVICPRLIFQRRQTVVYCNFHRHKIPTTALYLMKVTDIVYQTLALRDASCRGRVFEFVCSRCRQLTWIDCYFAASCRSSFFSQNMQLQR